MREDQKREIAVFRFGVISPLTGIARLGKGQKEAILRELTARQWEIPYSGRTYISRSTILNWLKRYEEGGRRIEALYPEERQDRGKLRAMDEDMALGLIELKKEIPHASLPVILKEAKKRGIIPSNFRVSNSSIYRLFQRYALNEKAPERIDRRRFEAEHANQLWQSDCMHGPMVTAQGKLRKSYLFAFIDDHSRLISHAEFYLRENIQSYIDCLRKALQKRGLPEKLYVDNGPTFRSHQLSFACASLGIALLHSRPYQPEGRGKIERWFQTVRKSLLSLIEDAISLDELNERLLKWIDEDYNIKVHSSTKETPLGRYTKHLSLIRPAPKDLNDHFRRRALRKVYRDRTVTIMGRVYEAPVELIGRSITLLYHEDDPSRIEAFYEGKSFGMLTVLNPHINSRIKRHQGITEVVPPEQPLKIKGGKLFRKGGNDNE